MPKNVRHVEAGAPGDYWKHDRRRAPRRSSRRMMGGIAAAIAFAIVAVATTMIGAVFGP